MTFLGGWCAWIGASDLERSGGSSELSLSRHAREVQDGLENHLVGDRDYGDRRRRNGRGVWPCAEAGSAGNDASDCLAPRARLLSGNTQSPAPSHRSHPGPQATSWHSDTARAWRLERLWFRRNPYVSVGLFRSSLPSGEALSPGILRAPHVARVPAGILSRSYRRKPMKKENTSSSSLSSSTTGKAKSRAIGAGPMAGMVIRKPNPGATRYLSVQLSMLG